MARNIALYPWFAVARSLTFWQSVWFLFFQSNLNAAQAVLIYAIYDVATTVLEVPSGYLSDRVGRRITLILSAGAMVIAAGLQVGAETFAVFALAQLFLGAGMAFSSGTDSALLYESLVAEGRGAEVEQQELRAWRAGFIALALSAVAGGAAYMAWDRAPFLLTTIAFGAALVIAFRFAEPVHRDAPIPQGDEVLRLDALRAAVRQPVLLWLMALSLLMYGFSHLPFVFGQPFILDALDSVGLAGETPLISGLVTAVMMLVSVAVSVIAPGIRARLGLAGVLLLAFGMQIGIVGVLAASTSVFAIAILLLRMVPDSLSRAFILARVQPLLGNEARATWLSLQSLAGRIVFAGSLWVASFWASDTGDLGRGELSAILSVYIAVGLAGWAALWAWSRRLRV